MMKSHRSLDLRAADRLINTLCDIAHGTHELRALSSGRGNGTLRRAISSHDNSALFSWLMRTFSYQGISDRAVERYIDEHGSVSFTDISKSIGSEGNCKKLGGFWTLRDCHYEKSKRICSCSDLINSCSLPKLPLRNGRLNQTAFSLFFFIRDVALGDLVNFVDQQIDQIPTDASPRDVHQILVPAWTGIFGVSDKVISMALATLLLGAPSAKRKWHRAGRSLIVVDSLVHNFLHRTGICSTFGKPHPYGPKCYDKDGCFDILGTLSKFVDARRFDSRFPSYFPRFVQLAIWRYCAGSAWNVCNGNEIDDRKRCKNGVCYLRNDCRKIRLK